MNRYMVVTPEYEVYSATEVEPPEYGSDSVEVDANSVDDAKIFAVQIWRKQRGRTYIKWYSDECPFSRLKVYMGGVVVAS